MLSRGSPVGLALIGCGNIGRTHALEIQRNKRCRLVTVFDADRARAEQFAREFAPKNVADRFETILNDSQVEGIVLATPHDLHFEQTIAALEAGKHVFTEKPMAMDAGQARQMYECSQRVNRRLLVGQCMRFWPNVVQAREAIKAGQVGRLHHVIRRRLVYQPDAGRPWAYNLSQSGGWLVHGNSVHELDALLYITDLAITRIHAVATCNNPKWHDVDELSAVLEFEGGAVGSYAHSLNSHGNSLETVLIGDAGSISLSDWHRGYALNGQSQTLGDNQGFGDEIMDFVRAIREGIPSRVDAAAVLPTMYLLETLKASVAQNTTLQVNLDLVHAVKVGGK